MDITCFSTRVTPLIYWGMAGIIKDARYWQCGMVWLVTAIDLAVAALEQTATVLDASDGYQKLKAARFHVK